MVVIKSTDIAPIAGKKVTEVLPSWLNKADDVIKGINQLFEHYYTLAGKKPPAKAAEGEAAAKEQPLSFSDARILKKAEMRENKLERGLVMPDMFKVLVVGLIKTCNTLEAMKLGDKKVGEAIYELPVTITQAKEFLGKIFTEHYGGK